MDALSALGFTARKHEAVRLAPLPCQVDLIKYAGLPGAGPEYDWSVHFANPGKPLRDGRLSMGLFDYHQASQRGMIRYDLSTQEQLQQFRQDFFDLTIPFVESATSYRRILQMLVDHEVRMSPARSADAENFARGKVALDFLAYGELTAEDAELAGEAVRRAISDGPAVKVRAGLKEALEISGFHFDLD